MINNEVMFTQKLTQGHLGTFVGPRNKAHQCSFLNFQRPEKGNMKFDEYVFIFLNLFLNVKYAEDRLRYKSFGNVFF